MQCSGIAHFFECNYAICLASDDAYSKYLYVTLSSIVQNSSPENFYDIVVLSSGVSRKQEKTLKLLERENVSIRLFDMDSYLSGDDAKSFWISGHVSKACYFRFFIPTIFSTYEKVLYLDCDIVVEDDIAKVFQFSLEGALLGVVLDADCHIYTESRKRYMQDVLKIDPVQYFCSGVLLYNIKEDIADGLPDRCMELLRKLKDPMYHDQDILNSVTFGRNVFLPMEWHYQSWIWLYHDIDEVLSIHPEFYGRYVAAANNIGLIHYGSSHKPWREPDIPFAELWWKYARTSPFYEQFLLGASHAKCCDELKRRESVQRIRLGFKLLFYRLMALCPLGGFQMKMRQKAEKTRKKLSCS